MIVGFKKGDWRRAWIAGLAVVGSLLVAPAANATEVPTGDILILAAHPDDDIITAAGVIKQATDAGSTVTIAYLTNGDRCETPSQVPANCSVHLPGIGDERQDESVAALQEVLGTDFDEDDMIFLGYPGGFLPYVRNGAPPLPADMPHTATYADRGLDRTDWHDSWTGAGTEHAPYTASAMSEDIFELIDRYRPDHIFTHSPFDRHSDHLTTYREVMEAISEVQDDVPSYDPYVHTTIVHVDAPATPLSWPDNGQDPDEYHVPVPSLDESSSGELNWDLRESFEVPAPMQNTNLSQNPKARAVEAHDTQADLEGGFIRRFVKRDEVFWIERIGTAEGIDDTYTVAEGGSLNVAVPRNGVLANDVRGVAVTGFPNAPDLLGPMMASIVNGPDHASSFSFDTDDGTFSYTHDGSATTSDTFTYRPTQNDAGDVTNGTTATVTITINLTDEDPTAVNDGPYDVEVGGLLQVGGPGILDNDSDPESSPLTAVVDSLPSHGTLNLNPDGSFTYQHTGTSAGTDSFSYRAKDAGNNTSNVATVAITIDPASSPIETTITGSLTGIPGVEAQWSATTSGGTGAYLFSWSVKLAGAEILPGSTATLSFTPTSGGVYTVDLTASDSSGSDSDSAVFTVIGDAAGNTFALDIIWLADSGITRGCVPDGTQFCPNDHVTREQMAAFLVRALELTDDGGGNSFTDDDGSVFEDDIAKLAAAGVTRGCNPPDNTKFCPKDRVTRAQMAAFLVRALGLTDDGGGNFFTDDDGSVFESDIAKLAASGITTGCTPDGTKFCPDAFVTRGQMAAFLHRAEPWLP